MPLSSRRSALAAVIICSLLTVGGCGRSNMYHVHVFGGDRNVEGGQPHWNGTTPWPVSLVRVYLPPAERRPTMEMFEFFADERPLGITPMFYLRDPSTGSDSSVLDYDLASLPDGEYLMVHRRSSIPPGLSPVEAHYDWAWSTFDGEDALVTTLLRRRVPTDADAGTAADAGL